MPETLPPSAPGDASATDAPRARRPRAVTLPPDRELAALGACVTALDALDGDAQQRVINYLSARYFPATVPAPRTFTTTLRVPPADTVRDARANGQQDESAGDGLATADPIDKPTPRTVGEDVAAAVSMVTGGAPSPVNPFAAGLK